MPGAASPRAAGALQPGALPAQIGSAEVCGSSLSAWYVPPPGRALGAKGQLSGTGNRLPSRLHPVSGVMVQQNTRSAVGSNDGVLWAGLGGFRVEEAASEWSRGWASWGTAPTAAATWDRSGDGVEPDGEGRIVTFFVHNSLVVSSL